MPANRNALVRYKTIDNCLRNKYRKWTLDDLIDACSDALYEYEGIDKGVSRRTVQMDIQMMRSEKLGYNAPIVVIDKKYYAYEDPDYSITNIPLTDQDLSKMTETVELLRQFKGFSHFRELEGMVQKLEDHVYSQKTNQRPVIDFEKNEDLKGLEFLDELYQSIIRKRAIQLTYQSFKARQPDTFNFHPYLLKEYRNRWFVLGIKKKKTPLLNLALDRIVDIEKSEVFYIENKEFDAKEHFKDAIGVSVSPTLPAEKVLLYITRKHAPYVLTKPFHPSQELVEKDNYGITISLELQHNFELEKEILGLGDGVKVIGPERLKRSIKERLNAGLDLYNTEISESGLVSAAKKLAHKGFCILNYVYTKREIKKIGVILERHFNETSRAVFAKRRLLNDLPELKTYLFNKNLGKIIRTFDPNAFIVKAIYFDKPAQSNWYVTWHQDQTINLKKKLEHEGYYGWTQKENVISACPPEEVIKNIFTIRIHLDDTNEDNGALRVLPGSQNKRLSDEEIQLITGNSLPFLCDVSAGGIQVMKPLLLHASSKSKSQKRRRVIHLEFASVQLADGLGWAEYQSI
ncbi:MAG: WYL domain-containing protein [Bacteroidota bacterium]